MCAANRESGFLAMTVYEIISLKHLPVKSRFVAFIIPQIPPKEKQGMISLLACKSEFV
jgi:hypothetical protein